MKTPSTILLAGLLAIGLNGCGGGEETPVASTTPTPGASVTAAPTTAATPGAPVAATPGADDKDVVSKKSNKDVKDAPFGDPLVAAKPVMVPGLIPGTDPAARVTSGVAKQGRTSTDPFFGEKAIPVTITYAPLPATATPSVGFNAGTGSGSPSNPTGISPGSVRSGFGSGPVIRRGSSGSGVGPRTGRVVTPPLKRAKNVGTSMAGKPGPKSIGASTGKSVGNSTGKSSVRGLPTPPKVAPRPDLPTLPSRPAQPIPTLANAVEVTGVVQIGSTMQAIVKAPDEPTSRYVGVGQRLANGQVLVKRIETAGSEPIVVLEESGVEVIRAIGQAAEGAPAKGEKPAAAALL
jgi:hypothetical protein